MKIAFDKEKYLKLQSENILNMKSSDEYCTIPIAILLTASQKSITEESVELEDADIKRLLIWLQALQS